jgi:Transglycosylase SLT domain
VSILWLRTQPPPPSPPVRRAVAFCAAVFIGFTLYAATQPVERITIPRGARPAWPAPVSVHELLIYAADRHGVPWQAAVALAEAESGGRPGLVHREKNGTVSYGVMQLNARWFKEAERMTTAENVEVGVGYLAKGRDWCADRLVADTRCAVDWYRGKRR